MSSLTCREFIEFLDDYVRNDLPAGRREAFESHVRGCPDCETYLKTYLETVRLAQSSLGVESADGPPPHDAPEELIRAILRSK